MMHRRLAADLSTIIDQDLDRASRFSLPSPPPSPITRLHTLRTRPMRPLRPNTSQVPIPTCYCAHTGRHLILQFCSISSNSVPVQVHLHATKSPFTSHDAASIVETWAAWCSCIPDCKADFEITSKILKPAMLNWTCHRTYPWFWASK